MLENPEGLSTDGRLDSTGKRMRGTLRSVRFANFEFSHLTLKIMALENGSGVATGGATDLRLLPHLSARCWNFALFETSLPHSTVARIRQPVPNTLASVTSRKCQPAVRGGGVGAEVGAFWRYTPGGSSKLPPAGTGTLFKQLTS